jgi:hypothetical protein
MKNSPHTVRQAVVLPPETMGYILKYFQPDCPQQFQDKAIFALTAYSALRIEDVDCCNSRDLMCVKHDAKRNIPRM